MTALRNRSRRSQTRVFRAIPHGYSVSVLRSLDGFPVSGWSDTVRTDKTRPLAPLEPWQDLAAREDWEAEHEDEMNPPLTHEAHHLGWW